MEVKSLGEIYSSIDQDVKKIYVVPLIRSSHKKTDYLYLLYEDLITGEEYQVESISIFKHFKLIAGILSDKKAILHYHWLEFQDLRSLAGMPWKLLCIWLFKLMGGKIVWTLHNEFPHDQKYLKLHSFLHKRMAAWAEKLHVHCSRAIEIMSTRLEASAEKFFVFPHPYFPADIQPKKQALDNINAEYGLDLKSSDKILLMFGNISLYKQIEEVAHLIEELSVECKLMIVGPIKKGNMALFKSLQSLERKSDRLIIIPKFIQEDQVPWFYNAADVCVFNYREILSSGGVHLSLSYNKPIIAPDKGCISELKDKPGVSLFEHQEGLEELLLQHLSPSNA